MHFSNVVKQMKQNMKENLKSAALALISIPVALAVCFAIDHFFHEWMDWVDLSAATLCIFGGLACYVHEDLKKVKTLIMFMGLFALHCAVFIHLLRSGVVIRTAWYTPIVFFESFVVGLILTGPGGARGEEQDRAGNTSKSTNDPKARPGRSS